MRISDWSSDVCSSDLQKGRRDVQHLQQLGIPFIAVDIEQHGARGIADIADVLVALGQLPHQPAVYRAKGKFAFGGLLARIRDVVQYPFELGDRKSTRLNSSH